VALYVRTASGLLWGPKPGAGSSAAVGADGSWTIAGWASGGAGDANAPALVAYALPAGVAPPTVLGAAAPAALTGGAVATAVSTRNGNVAPPPPPPPAVASPVAPPPPPPAAGTAVLTLNAPAVGAVTAVTGTLTGVPIAGHRVSAMV
jgi:hypothetical protein